MNTELVAKWRKKVIRLTNSEKVKRYDALQSAINITIACYSERVKNSEKLQKQVKSDILSAYHLAEAETLKAVIEDLERWV